MYWGELFLGFTLATLLGVYRLIPARVAVVGLLMWTALEKIIYQFDVVELAGTLLITGIFLLYNLVALVVFRRLVFIYMLAGGCVAIAWTLVCAECSAYLFKAGKNVDYAACLVSVWVSYFSSRAGRV